MFLCQQIGVQLVPRIGSACYCRASTCRYGVILYELKMDHLPARHHKTIRLHLAYL